MQHTFVLRAICVAAFLLLAASFQTMSAQARRALIIGIGEYEHLTKLGNVPVQDAAGYAAVFRDKLKFDDVETLPNLSQSSFLNEFVDFLDRIEEGDTVVFIFSGHGWSDGAENYLAFKDTPSTGTETSRKLVTVPLSQTILARLQERSPGAIIAIIDACRNNPFSDMTKSLPKGLGPIQEREGVLVAFAAGQGQTALAQLPTDQNASYSVFTRYLLPRLTNPRRPISRIFEEVRNDVQRETSRVPHLQRPAIYNELPLDYCFSGNCRGGLDDESSLWIDASQLTGTLEACKLYEEYTALYPEGRFIVAARNHAALPPCVEKPTNSGYQTMADANTAGRFLTIGLDEPLDRIDSRTRLVCAEASATVYFDYDQLSINADAADALGRFMAFQDCTISRIIIEGHDDGLFVNEDGSRISKEYSLGLSQRRASAVADYFVSMGAPKEKIITHAFGDTRPAVANGEPGFNRRVQVTVIYSDQI
jgi:outer membrane protein OmpA-like peptidoglycan-associated protein